jgi:hypothetical protein
LKEEKSKPFAPRGKAKQSPQRSPRAGSKGREEKVMEGAISCLYFGERCKEVPDPELFIGFESGAIGMFRVFIDYSKKSE